MPESFHTALKSAVEEQMRTEYSGHDHKGNFSCKKFGWKRAAVFVAVAILALGTTVYAADYFGILGSSFFGKNEEAVGKLIQEGTEAMVNEGNQLSGDMGEVMPALPDIPEQGDLLSIEETMCDGDMLYIYANATEAGEKYALNADRLFVDDMEVGPVDTMEHEDNPGGYVFKVDVSQQKLSDTFTVTLPLSVYEKQESGEPEAEPVRYKNQDMNFQVTKTDTLRHGQDVEQTQQQYTVHITEISASLTQTKLKAVYTFDEEQLKNYQSGDTRIMGIIVRDSGGNEYSMKGMEMLETENSVEITWTGDGILDTEDTFVIVPEGMKTNGEHEFFPYCEEGVTVRLS